MKMNQKKHLGFALGVATAVAIAVTGCSSTSGGSSSGSGSNSSSKQVNLSVTWWGGQARNDATIKVTDMYTKEHPNVHFTNSYQSFDGYFDKLSMLAAAGNMPDVFQFTVGQATGSEFITKGLIQPLDSYVSNKELDLSHFGTSAISTGKLNGKL